MTPPEEAHDSIHNQIWSAYLTYKKDAATYLKMICMDFFGISSIFIFYSFANVQMKQFDVGKAKMN